MDHIEALPLSEGYDSILVVVCRLTKQAIFIPANTTDDSPQLARHFIDHVFSKHGLPTDIVSDRGHLFTSKFWSSLCSALGIHSNLSTAYHPETDGQTERINQILEQYLRIYTNYQQNDWKSLLPIAEFAYNNAPHSTTGVSPFFANKGYHPSLDISTADIPSQEAQFAASDLNAVHKYLREQIKIANDRYKKFADTHREQTPDWPVGTKVWLDARNIKTKRPMKKLDHKKLGPFEISAKVSTHAYRLKLPSAFKAIHNVFHVVLLEKAFPDKYPQRKSRPPPIEIDGEKEYEVAAILDSRKRRGNVQYLVRWAGYGPEDDSWEPRHLLEGATEALAEFHESYPQKPRAPSPVFS
jgi:Chromo (CHRromatin Organisation MOdifier) domain